LTDPIPSQEAFSIHLNLRANRGGRLWLGGKLIPTGKLPSAGVTILDLEQEPVAFFPNPSTLYSSASPAQRSMSLLMKIAPASSIAHLAALRDGHIAQTSGNDCSLLTSALQARA
jgi:hypothetical protein